MKWLLDSACLVALCLAVTPAIAQQDLYDNGPTDGNTLGWVFNLGFNPSDSFTLNSAATVNGLQFAAWLFPGDVLETAEVSITSSEFGGTTYFSQVVSFTQTGCVLNLSNYDVCNETGSFSPINLNAGSYWMNLQNGVVNDGDPVFWDQNSGPSQASESSLGTIPSESFTIMGSRGGAGTTPEPSSILLVASGGVGIFEVVRRKFFA